MNKDKQLFEFPGALDAKMCAEIIELFEACPDEHSVIHVGKGESTDIYISRPVAHWIAYDLAICRVIDVALDTLHFMCPEIKIEAGLADEGYCIQRKSTGQFYDWHADTTGSPHRRLSAVLYLNDDFTGGETEFALQKVKIKPETGKLVLFPPYWTHTHWSRPVETGTKYIAATWMAAQDVNL